MSALNRFVRPKHLLDEKHDGIFPGTFGQHGANPGAGVLNVAVAQMAPRDGVGVWQGSSR
jgi:hypothetical protein